MRSSLIKQATCWSKHVSPCGGALRNTPIFISAGPVQLFRGNQSDYFLYFAA